MEDIKINNNDREMLSGALSLTVSVIIVKIIGFVYKIPLSRILGDEGMGYFNSAYTVFTFFYMLCSAGIPKAVAIIITESDTKYGKYGSDKSVSFMLKIAIIIGASMSLFLFFGSKIISEMIGSKEASECIRAISPSILFVSAAGVLRGFLNGRKKLLEVAVSEVIDGAVKFIVGLAFAYVNYKNGGSLSSVSAYAILGVSIGAMISSLFLFVSVNISKSDEKAGQNSTFVLSKISLIKKILRIALPITVSSAVLSLSNVIDLGMIMNRLKASGMSEEDAVAAFGNFTTLAVPMLNLVSALTNSISVSSLPALASSFSIGKKEEFERISNKAFSGVAFFAIPASCAFMFFSEEILRLLFDDNSAKIAAPLLSVLAPSVIFLPILTVCNTILESTQKTKLPLISMCIGLFIKTVISFVLISKRDIGIFGAPIGTGACYAAALVVSIIFIRYKVGMKIKIFAPMIKYLILAFIIIFPMRLIYIYIESNYNFKGSFIIISMLSAVLYFLIVHIFDKSCKKFEYKLIKINKKIKSTL